MNSKFFIEFTRPRLKFEYGNWFAITSKSLGNRHVHFECLAASVVKAVPDEFDLLMQRWVGWDKSSRSHLRTHWVDRLFPILVGLRRLDPPYLRIKPKNQTVARFAANVA